MANEVDGVGALGLLVALGQTACFFGARLLPKETVRTVEQFRVLNVPSGVGMDGFVGCVTIEDFKLVGVQLEELGQGKVGNG
jgi:hypothetical protein